ncbi:hypothetical protein FEZ18_04060 [Oceanihabitans sp. IOP_32]|uniref:type IX secretion system protein PorG n=1 Tax=Oceanihabitans sp. IOP_32 TaxID=2529032 RepID=UPI0012937E34|nr:DUF6089 family protein [Oceanihabitans sp. IOP_32]QFZ54039.1 hypothetical protein FEZ18_04060 [Oceanihabitans sp. IOP_32]
MRYFTVLIISILSITSSYSQNHELGVFVGGSNLIGDVGATNYISPNSPTLGLIYKWNASPRHSWRASLIYSDLKAKDFKSDDPRRQQRDYNFDSNLLEISAGIEFTFFDFDLYDERTTGTPYLYSGISMAKHDNFYFFNGVQTPENNSSWAIGIPMALGFKTNIIDNFIIGIEVGARYTFSDAIDGSNPKEAINQQYRFGNINNNDWYVFSGVTLTYTFGIKPCYY